MSTVGVDFVCVCGCVLCVFVCFLSDCVSAAGPLNGHGRSPGQAANCTLLCAVVLSDCALQWDTAGQDKFKTVTALFLSVFVFIVCVCVCRLPARFTAAHRA